MVGVGYPVISQMFSSGCRVNVPFVGWVTEYRANLLKNHHAVFLQCKTPSHSRFSGAQHHYYLLDFLQSVAKHYFDNGQAGDLIVDLLKLGVPKLSGVEGREDETVGHKFSRFLQGYISRHSLKHIILEKMGDIMVRKADIHILCMQTGESLFKGRILGNAPTPSSPPVCNLRPAG